jgi:hypothetical protein
MSVDNADAGPPLFGAGGTNLKSHHARAGDREREQAARHCLRGGWRRGRDTTARFRYNRCRDLAIVCQPVAFAVCGAGQCAGAADATLRRAIMTLSRNRPARRGSDVRKCYARTSYSAENMSSIGRRRNCANPASATSSRAFGSPMHAPIPAPPCASDTVMQ